MSRPASTRPWPHPLCTAALLLFALVLMPLARGHDVDVTGVARVFLDEETDGQYRLSIVDQQVPPLFNVERILPERCLGLAPGRFSYRFE